VLWPIQIYLFVGDVDLFTNQLSSTGIIIAQANASEKKHFGQPLSNFGQTSFPNSSSRAPLAARKKTGVHPIKNIPNFQIGFKTADENINP